MELRHLKYFIAVAEEGSLTVAAEKRLHTAQPSLSRQIRDLEYEVGTPLFTRSVQGVELTAAGRAFIDHARLAVTQADAARDAARRAAKPANKTFAIGFLMGQEINWLAEATRIIASDLPNIELTVSSQYSPDLAEALSSSRLDLAFMRAEPGWPELDYITISSEPFVMIMPSDHRLTKHKKVDIREIAGEIFIGASDIAGPMRRKIEEYLAANNLDIKPAHRIHNLTMAMSLIASTRGVAILPMYALNFLPWSVTSRPLKGTPPTIDLVVGYKKSNTSPILKSFLSRVDQLKEKPPSLSSKVILKR
ncbi:LysR family transcriptional regulator [Pedosphaera parvula]|nr:LysR family transcriptional regulator [Pedosphaera parvula]